MKTINYKHRRKEIVGIVRETYGDVVEHVHYDELEDMLLEKAEWPQGKKSEDFRGIKGRK